ncbi:MAG: hypothetical protein JSR46_01270 [Verrucomicrobia bacterium]|nr:hypothetical protein [Verrucomicrobiota bacterium]
MGTERGFPVSDVGYFLCCNGKKDLPAFQGKLEFDVTIFPYKGSDSWIDAKLHEIKDCLSSSQPPEPHQTCNQCRYRRLVDDVIRQEPDEEWIVAATMRQ